MMTVIMQTSRPCLLRLSSCCYQRTVAKRPLSRKANTDLIRIAKTVESADPGTILVMAGAGLSTPSGIPDFRSPGSGIYDNLAQYNLPYPGRHFAIFDISYFRHHPKPFNVWSKEFLPGINYRPSIGHYFIRLLQDKELLLRHYTQNIDGLETLAGIEDEKIVAAHGSFGTASCISCGRAVDFGEVKKKILEDAIPECSECGGLVKPDIVFFGEMLPQRFHTYSHVDTAQAQVLICIGTSLEVYPFAGIADNFPYDRPRILINRDLVGSFGCRDYDHHVGGDLVNGIKQLAQHLGWKTDLDKYIPSSR